MPTSEWKRNWSLEKIDEAVADLKEYISELEAKANEVTGKIMPVKLVSGMFGKRYTNIDSYAESRFTMTSTSTKVQRARAQCDEIWKEVCETHEANKEALENNIALYDKVVLFMHNIGIPSESLEYPLKRNGQRSKEPARKSAGYLTDLHKHLLRDDGFSTAQQKYEKFRRQIDEYESQLPLGFSRPA